MPVLALLVLLLGGCSAKQPIESMPKASEYGDIYQNDAALTQYVDDLNWYLMYVFSYTKVMNGFAKNRHWIPPSEPPLCRFITSPTMEPLPKFNPKEGSDFEWELSTYVRDVRQRYEELRKDQLLRQQFHQYICVY